MVSSNFSYTSKIPNITLPSGHCDCLRQFLDGSKRQIPTISDVSGHPSVFLRRSVNEAYKIFVLNDWCLLPTLSVFQLTNGTTFKPVCCDLPRNSVFIGHASNPP